MIVKARRVTITNDVGGTTEVDGPFKVKVTARYIDDEIGAVVHGQLVDEKDITKARKAGTTGYGPEDYRQYGAKAEAEVVQARKLFNPSKVYMIGSDCTPVS